jgi:hypothetical protein
VSIQLTADTPKVFISYSWKPFQHQQKVIALAERLMNDGVHAIIDVWDLREGQDKNQFMESMVTDPEVKRVLIICNKSYKEKADSRTGGVGTESLIMSNEIYSKADQTKFVPLIFEADEQGEAYLPVFVRSRIYLDFKDDEVFEDSYEKLLRNIFDKPTHQRPALGIRPSYLEEEQPLFLATAHRVAAIKTAFANERKNAPQLVREYYQAFLLAVKDFEPRDNEFTADNYIELVLSRIEQMQPLRDDFLSFLGVYCSALPTLDTDAIHDFFEQFAQYFSDTGATTSDNYLSSLQYDYLRFFIYELLLYFVAALIKHTHYNALSEFLHDSLIVIPQYRKAEPEDFVSFNPYNFTLNRHYNTKYKTNRTSIVADKVKERVQSNYTFEELQQADVLLHVVSVFHQLTPGSNPSRWLWQPETSVYNAHRLPFFDKLISARYFERVKRVFGVDSVGAITNLLAKFQNDSQMQSSYRRAGWDYRGLPDIVNLLSEEKLAKFK